MVKRKIKRPSVPQYGTGGDVLNSLGGIANMIPGWGQLIGGALGTVGGIVNNTEATNAANIEMIKQKQKSQWDINKQDHLSSVLGTQAFANGGAFLTKMNAPTHANGGAMVDSNGNPAAKGVAEVEKDETILKGTANNFAFSPNLIDPVTGKTFAKASKGVESKLKSQLNDGNDIANRTRKSQFKRLQKGNETQKEQIDQMTMAIQSKLSEGIQMANGGSFGDPIKGIGVLNKESSLGDMKAMNKLRMNEQLGISSNEYDLPPNLELPNRVSDGETLQSMIVPRDTNPYLSLTKEQMARRIQDRNIENEELAKEFARMKLETKANGGRIKKYANGGGLPKYNPLTGQFEMTDDTEINVSPGAFGTPNKLPKEATPFATSNIESRFKGIPKINVDETALQNQAISGNLNTKLPLGQLGGMDTFVQQDPYGKISNVETPTPVVNTGKNIKGEIAMDKAGAGVKAFGKGVGKFAKGVYDGEYDRPIGLTAKATEMIASGIAAFRNPEQIPLNLNPNALEAEDVARSSGISYNQARQSARESLNSNRANSQNAMSNAVKLALNQGAQNQYVEQMGNIATQEKAARNQQNANVSNLLNQLGVQDMSARNLQEQLQSQTNAVSADAKKTFAESVGNMGEFFLNKDVTQRKSNEQFKLLKNRYPNFNVSAENLSQYNNMLEDENTTAVDLFVFGKQQGISDTTIKKHIKKFGSKNLQSQVTE